MALPMWAVLATIEFITLGIFTTYLVRFYAAKGSPTYALALVFISWYLGFFGTMFLPIDIAEAYFSTYTNITNVTEAVATGIPTPSRSPSGLPTVFPFTTVTPVATTGAGGVTATITPPPPVANVTATRTSSRSSTSTFTFTYSPSSTATWTSSITVSNSPTPTYTIGMVSHSSSPTKSAVSVTPTKSTTATKTLTATSTTTGSNTPTPTKTPPPSPTRSPLPASATPSHSRAPSRSPVWPTPSNSPAAEAGGGDCEGGCGRLLDEEGTEIEGGGEERDWDAPSTGLWSRVLVWLGQTDVSERDAKEARHFRRLPVVSPSSSNSTTDKVMPSPSPSQNASSNSNTTTTVMEWELVSNVVQLRNGPLEQLWMWVYWLTFLLTYIVIPVTQEYVAAGEFTKRGRLCAAIKINMIFYAACGVIAFGALAYVVIGLNQGLWDLMPVLISLANTLGLVIIILLLGYGTAEVPRAIWKRSNPEALLRRLYFKAPEMDGQVFDVANLLTETVKQISEFEGRITQMAGDKSFLAEGTHTAALAEFQRCLHIVNRKVALANDLLGKTKSKPNARARKLAAAPEPEEDEDESSNSSGFFGSMSKVFGGNSKYKGVTVAKLAKLHKKLMLHISKLRKTQFRFESLVIDCIELEYVVAEAVPPVPVKKITAEGKTYFVVKRGAGLDAQIGNSNTNNNKAGAANGKGKGGKGQLNVFDSKTMKQQVGGAAANLASDEDELSEKAASALMSMMCAPRWFGGALNHFVWNFKIYAIPYAFKVLYVVAEICSLLLLWSEATIFLNLTGIATENLSVFGWILKGADELGSHGYVAIQLAAFFPLAYMCLCSTYSVFKLKLFDMMDLSPNQNTDPYSLLVCASLFNRLQFSLAFNYLNVLMHSTNKADYPNTAFLNSVGARMDLSVVDWYLPIAAFVIYIACKINVFDRCLRLIGIEESGDPSNGNRDHENMIRDGILVVKKGRRTLGLGGGDADDEEAREKQDMIARDRLKAVMARAQARREGRNPDEVAPLDSEMEAAAKANGTMITGDDGEVMYLQKTGGYASGGATMSSTAGMMSLDNFSGAGSVGGAAGSVGGPRGGGGASNMGGLAALAQRAGMGKIGAAFNQFGATLGLGGELSGEGGAVVDHGDDEEGVGSNATHNSKNSSSHNSNSGPNGGGGGGGFSGFSRHDHGTADLMRARELVGVQQAIQTPPTLAELLKGKRKL